MQRIRSNPIKRVRPSKPVKRVKPDKPKKELWVFKVVDLHQTTMDLEIRDNEYQRHLDFYSKYPGLDMSKHNDFHSGFMAGMTYGKSDLCRKITEDIFLNKD